MSVPQAKNHLSETQSPYLLQHADNPVHWYAWGDEAFEAAKREDKPIFLSIGYATCHWCHVMAHESFEDEEIADRMNDLFISIKVDREERPAIDNTYMQVCQMLTGRGGWPLTIVMTPDKEPFYAATYLPKNSRRGQPGMMELIPRIDQLWNEKRDEIEGSAQKITQAFQKSISPQQRQPLPESILGDAQAELQQQYDDTYGGFGSAPKFPTPHTLVFLLRYAHLFDDERARTMAEKTLINMRHGGLFDHIGGGFHRYSTDAHWLLPHFEKMLYDQAMHLIAYSEAYQALGNPLFRQTDDEIATYLLRDMQHEGGAFYSAEDADSEGKEGTFYVWSMDEVREVLSAEDAVLAIEIFTIKAEGNYKDESTGRPTGKNILHYTKPLAELAADNGSSLESFRQRLDNIQQQLFEYREQRERPFLDDKILTDWNGLAVAALAKAGRLLDKPEYIRQAERAVAFIFEELRQEDGCLLHRYRDGEGAISGTADDYAFLLWGLLELYESTFRTAYLKEAVNLQEVFNQSHWDDENGGFFFTPQESEALLGRKKEYIDSALPSGNSVAAGNLLRLGRIAAKSDWEEKAELIVQSTAKMVQQMPASFTHLLQAQLWSRQKPYEIVIAGEKDAEETQQFLKRLHRHYEPCKVVILNDPDDEVITAVAPFTKNQPMLGGKPTTYVCQNYTCKQPAHSAEEMMKLL
jgi:uncharacterized protein YyaL (SSP411 family)